MTRWTGPLHGTGPLLEGARTCPAGTPLRLIPDGEADWKWVDFDGHTIIDLALPGLTVDPAAWWAGVLLADSVERVRGKVPTSCGQPMQATPIGWRCRTTGRVFAYQETPT